MNDIFYSLKIRVTSISFVSIVMGILAIIGSLLVLLLPETKGREMPNTVEEMLKISSEKKKSSIVWLNDENDNDFVLFEAFAPQLKFSFFVYLIRGMAASDFITGPCMPGKSTEYLYLIPISTGIVLLSTCTIGLIRGKLRKNRNLWDIRSM